MHLHPAGVCVQLCVEYIRLKSDSCRDLRGARPGRRIAGETKKENTECFLIEVFDPGRAGV